MMAPEIEKLRDAHKDWVIEEIEIDSNSEESEKYDIGYVPTLIINQMGEMKRLVGFKTKEDIEKTVKEMIVNQHTKKIFR